MCRDKTDGNVRSNESDSRPWRKEEMDEAEQRYQEDFFNNPQYAQPLFFVHHVFRVQQVQFGYFIQVVGWPVGVSGPAGTGMFAFRKRTRSSYTT